MAASRFPQSCLGPPAGWGGTTSTPPRWGIWAHWSCCLGRSVRLPTAPWTPSWACCWWNGPLCSLWECLLDHCFSYYFFCYFELNLPKLYFSCAGVHVRDFPLRRLAILKMSEIGIYAPHRSDVPANSRNSRANIFECSPRSIRSHTFVKRKASLCIRGVYRV